MGSGNAEGDDSCTRKMKEAFTIKNNRLAVEFFAEFLGTFVLIVSGNIASASHGYFMGSIDARLG